MLMNEILEKIESYDFKDPLGHELKLCKEWIEVKRLLVSSKKLIKHLRKNDPKWATNVNKMLSKQKIKTLSEFIDKPVGKYF